MDRGNIRIMGTIRINGNRDYDKLQNSINNHKAILQHTG